MSPALEDSLRQWVLQRLRTGFTIEMVAEALAAEKVRLMQTDEYIKAIPPTKGESDGV